MNNASFPAELRLDTSKNFLIYFGAVLGASAFLVLVICLLLRRYSRQTWNTGNGVGGKGASSLGAATRRSAASSMKDLVRPSHDNFGVIDNVFRNPAYVSFEEQLGALEFPRVNMCFTRDLGTSLYGKTYLAEAVGIKEGEMTSTVYVKTLAEDNSASVSSKIRDDFRLEMSVAAEFNHPNIAALLGVCTAGDEPPRCLLYEHSEYGPLNAFLQSARRAYHVKDADASSVELEHHLLNDSDLAAMASQVADALNYMAARDFVHSDVAARNCQVTAKLTVKVVEFGLNKDVNSQDYFRVGRNQDVLLPVRWMAPEAIKNRVFTVESDVWSFGVLVWEIFTFGARPYAGMSNGEAIGAIVKCRRLERPRECPDDVFGVMNQCWNPDPTKRPRFFYLHKMLSALAETNESEEEEKDDEKDDNDDDDDDDSVSL